MMASIWSTSCYLGVTACKLPSLSHRPLLPQPVSLRCHALKARRGPSSQAVFFRGAAWFMRVLLIMLVLALAGCCDCDDEIEAVDADLQEHKAQRHPEPDR